MALIPDATAALNLLCDHLQSRFDAKYRLEFLEYGPKGVKVMGKEQEPDPDAEDQEDVGGPHILIWPDNDDDAPEWGMWARRLTFGVNCNATEFNGAIEGVDVKLSTVLYEIIDNDYATLRDMGLMNARIRKRRPRREQEQIVYIKPHEISVVYLTR